MPEQNKKSFESNKSFKEIFPSIKSRITSFEDIIKKENTEFVAILNDSINEGNAISQRCNEKIAEARIKYPFLQTPSKAYQPGGEFHHLVQWSGDSVNGTNSLDLPPPYDHPPSYASKSFNPLDPIGNRSDDQLVEEILYTSEEELDEIFEEMTYEKLAELVNTLPKEQAQKLVKHLMPEHIEKLMEFISIDKLSTYIDSNLSLEELTEQELSKLSSKDISDEQLENIIILAGEERLAEKLDIIPNDKLATIISHASDESLVRIININLPKILPLLPFEKIKQITTLMDDKEVIEQLEKQGEEEYNSSNEEYPENFVNSGSSVGLLGNSEKTGYNSDDSGIESDFDPNDTW